MKSEIQTKKDLGKRMFIPVICNSTSLGNGSANTAFIFEWVTKYEFN